MSGSHREGQLVSEEAGIPGVYELQARLVVTTPHRGVHKVLHTIFASFAEFHGTIHSMHLS